MDAQKVFSASQNRFIASFFSWIVGWMGQRTEKQPVV